MKMEVRPAAWRCGYYSFSGSWFYNTHMIFIFLKNTSNTPIVNGSPSSALLVKPTTTLVNIIVIELSYYSFSPYSTIRFVLLLSYAPLVTFYSTSQLCFPAARKIGGYDYLTFSYKFLSTYEQKCLVVH